MSLRGLVRGGGDGARARPPAPQRHVGRAAARRRDRALRDPRRGSPTRAARSRCRASPTTRPSSPPAERAALARAALRRGRVPARRRAASRGVPLSGEPGRGVYEQLWRRPALAVTALEAMPLAGGREPAHRGGARAGRAAARARPGRRARDAPARRARSKRDPPRGVRVETKLESASPGWSTEPVGPAFDAMRRALRAGFEREPSRSAAAARSRSSGPSSPSSAARPRSSSVSRIRRATRTARTRASTSATSARPRARRRTCSRSSARALARASCVVDSTISVRRARERLPFPAWPAHPPAIPSAPAPASRPRSASASSTGSTPCSARRRPRRSPTRSRCCSRRASGTSTASSSTEAHVKALAALRRDARSARSRSRSCRAASCCRTSPACLRSSISRRCARRIVRMTGDESPKKVNPLVPCDLVIDHSVQVDAFALAGRAAASTVEHRVRAEPRALRVPEVGRSRRSTTSASSRRRRASCTR